MKKEYSIIIKISPKGIIALSSFLILSALFLINFAGSNVFARQVIDRGNNPLDYLKITTQVDQPSLTILSQNKEAEGGQLTLEHPKNPQKNVHLDLYEDLNGVSWFRIHTSKGTVIWKQKLRY